MNRDEAEIEKFRKRYANRLKNALNNDLDDQGIKTHDYEIFRKQYYPRHMNIYERLCNLSEKILRINPDKAKKPLLEEAINICHLKVTPSGTASFAILTPIIIVVTFILFGYFLPFALTGGEFVSLFFIMFGLIAALLVMIPLQSLPFMLANMWRLRASNQMVLSIFYMVTYMRHTSNLELAIDFAAEHLSPPLSLDLKKIIWNIETEQFRSVKESLDHYLMSWRKWNSEFIESMHLIESSLYESSETRRLNALDKSLTVMLDETYEKMMHYAHNLKGPLTTLHMLGVILPILGLVILPLVVSFMPEVKWYHLLALYNVALPLGVYYLGKDILSKRPTGYGQTDIAEINPELKKYRRVLFRFGQKEVRISPMAISLIVFGVLFFIGIIPLLLWGLGGDCADWSIVAGGGVARACDLKPDATVTFALLDYRDERIHGEMTGNKIGPYGLGAGLISLFVPLAFAAGFGLYYKLRSQNIVKIRKRAKQLEKEFAAALFQLGNRLGDGFPAEIAFSKVANVMEDTVSGKFFDLVSTNIQKLGMGVEQAIFDPEKGALVYYPSDLIESSMKVLIESSKKGPLIASQALINVSEYIKQMHRVDERLRDLMADVISSMKSQIAFLTPAIAGIVIGITTMIANILGTLGDKLTGLGDVGGESSLGSMAFIFDLFGSSIPTYYFQIIVGLYVVQIAYILTILINGIQNGADKLNERFLLGKNLIQTTITYLLVAGVVMVLFSIVASSIGGTINVNV